VDRQNRVAPYEDSTSEYTLLGFDAGYRFDFGITLTARLDNTLNVSYKDHLTRIEERNNPMPGRNLNINLRWNF